MLIFFFFFRKKRGKNKDRKKEKDRVMQCPEDHAGSRTCGCSPARRPGRPLPGRGSVADTSHPRHRAIPASPVSAQMGRRGKSLFDEASEGW